MSNELTFKGRAILMLQEKRRDLLIQLEDEEDTIKRAELMARVDQLREAVYMINGLTDHNSLNQYQKLSSATAIYPKDAGLIYTVLGLVSESGELAGKLKKIIRDKGGEFGEDERNAMRCELGD
jgi:hypothetical protein